MRTNSKIDVRLRFAAVRASGCKAKCVTVDERLRLLVRKKAYSNVLALRGKIHWEGDASSLRRAKRR